MSVEELSWWALITICSSSQKQCLVFKAPLSGQNCGALTKTKETPWKPFQVLPSGKFSERNVSCEPRCSRKYKLQQIQPFSHRTILLKASLTHILWRERKILESKVNLFPCFFKEQLIPFLISIWCVQPHPFLFFILPSINIQASYKYHITQRIVTSSSPQYPPKHPPICVIPISAFH